MNNARARIIDDDGVGEWMELDAAYAHAQHGQIMEKITASDHRGMRVELYDMIGVDWGSDLGGGGGDVCYVLEWLQCVPFRALPSGNEALRVMRHLLDEINEQLIGYGTSEIRVGSRDVLGVDWGSDLSECSGDISDVLRWLERAPFLGLPSRDEAVRVMRELLDEIRGQLISDGRDPVTGQLRDEGEKHVS